MNKARSQMILIAVLVCLFAVGMSGLLNFFKYRATADRLIKDRLVVTGAGIENSIRSSLALGLQFSDIGTLPETMDRERSTDELIRTIEVFDNDGNSLYSTDKLRAMRGVPAAWVQEAKDAGAWVFGGGPKGQQASVVATDRTVTDGPVPADQGGPRRVRGR